MGTVAGWDRQWVELGIHYWTFAYLWRESSIWNESHCHCIIGYSYCNQHFNIGSSGIFISGLEKSLLVNPEPSQLFISYNGGNDFYIMGKLLEFNRLQVLD